jgi:hypothetical protein
VDFVESSISFLCHKVTYQRMEATKPVIEPAGEVAPAMDVVLEQSVDVPLGTSEQLAGGEGTEIMSPDGKMSLRPNKKKKFTDEQEIQDLVVADGATPQRKRVMKRPKDYSEVTGEQPVPKQPRKYSRKEKEPQPTEHSATAVVGELGVLPVAKKEKKPRHSGPKRRLTTSGAAGSGQSKMLVVEALHERLLRDLGKARLDDLLQLIDGLAEHKKQGGQASTLRSHLQSYMSKTSKWSGDTCSQYLTTMRFSEENKLMKDIQLTELFIRNISIGDLVERFTKPNWDVMNNNSPEIQPAADSTQKVPETQLPVEDAAATATQLEEDAFALWATTDFVANNGPIDNNKDLLELWTKIDSVVRNRFIDLVQTERRMKQIFQSRQQEQQS